MKYLPNIALLSLFLSIAKVGYTQEIAWDNTAKSKWNPVFQEVSIPSSQDSSNQQAYFFKSTSKRPQPLIISLHTWSGDFRQADPLTKEILARNWNYIHPDFRGMNRTPKAMGSPFVISDIKDAISYAVKQGNVDTSEIHIIGVSGGGFATLCAYMQLDYPIKSFSAWAPISNIEAWYWESLGRGQKYAADIAAALGGEFNAREARKRSPLFQLYPKQRRQNSALYIYEGIHDGYTGSVPITQAINMYNRLVAEQKYQVSNSDSISAIAPSDQQLVSDREIIDLLTKRTVPTAEQGTKSLFDRKVYLEKQTDNIHLTIFEGTHEQLPQALAFIPVHQQDLSHYQILTIGDSNGEIKGGWVTQLGHYFPNANIINMSSSGRSIGFDPEGVSMANALKHIDSYLTEAKAKSLKHPFDYIIVCLGTNDTKVEFKDRQGEVPKNLAALLTKIKKHGISTKKTRLLYVSPPPIVPRNAKYVDSDNRLADLIAQLKATTSALGFQFVDAYHPLLGILDYYAADGLHMSAAGQAIVAAQIITAIEESPKHKH
ncbi:SGNH/GDSL hydrolase family protein [Sphingobacterium siyangense]|uniref:SGNH/GDSL hydrolase family protein n=1 Tax=Sphingobacterium siyangense TaxID=459529 RepID=UPI003DA26095